MSKQIQVAGCAITQIDETEYEAENTEQGLDFHFDMGHTDAVEVFVFDSDVPTQGDKDPCITAFYAADLEQAVTQAMALTKRGVNATSRQYGVVERLRDISKRLDVEPGADLMKVLLSLKENNELYKAAPGLFRHWD